MNAVEKYLRELRDLRDSGEAVDETSYYPALSNLLNAVGATLKPSVKAILPIRNRGAGIPDGGFFTADQFRRGRGDIGETQIPSRGALEAKPTATNIDSLAQSEQVRRYLSRYGLVLLTNYREFLAVTADASGVKALERLSLAADEWSFWRAARDPATFAKQQGERVTEYLRRVMTRQAPLVTPHDLSALLASYAREARLRVEEADLPALSNMRSSLEEALGLHFEGDKGEHFFRSTLVQTLFYGIFSAWVLWAKRRLGEPAERFSWREAAWSLRVPMIRALFEQVATPSRLGPLNLVEVLDWTADALNRVDRAAFFEAFDESQAVQYFYEPFLRAFDPELRKQLGVWYTPQEIVEYIVKRVDRVLREELGIADGFADPRVYVLDPACGTGAFIVEVLRSIYGTLKEKRDDALLASDLKDAATSRVIGFEILPAPFVIAHLQVGLLLQAEGAPLVTDEGERAAVFLTNALTGWKPPSDEAKKRIEQLTLAFPELRDERDAAEKVKRDAPILVILGNPPYNGFAGVSPEEEDGLLEPYKANLKRWGITKNYLDDLYVRFFRLAERRIAEQGSTGIVSFISNHSFVDEPSYVVVREHLLRSFDKIWIDGLHGDRKSSEYAPDGRTSETIFASPGFSVGIQQGVAISTWVKRSDTREGAEVYFRDDFNAARAAERRRQLLASADDPAPPYERVSPTAANLYSFRRFVTSASFGEWPTVAELGASEPILGLNENRHQALHDFSKDSLVARMRAYYDPSVAFDELRHLHPGLVTDAAGFNATITRNRLLRESKFDAQNVRQMVFRPFDVRWCYVERHANLWNRIRPELISQVSAANEFLYVRRNAPKPEDGAPMFYSVHIADQHALHKDAYLVPFLLRRTANAASDQGGLFSTEARDEYEPNLSARAKKYLSAIGLAPDTAESARLVWLHALAVGYSRRYLAENADAVRRGWPRVPLPMSASALEFSAALGASVAGLLKDPGESRPAPHFGSVATIAADGQVHAERGHLSLRAGWGYEGQRGITMPGSGKVVQRSYTPEELETIRLLAQRNHLGLDEALQQLGETSLDVFLNDHVYWKNVPVNVWEFVVGGYQALKKWLSYREEEILGRPLSKQEAREFTNTATSIAHLLLLQPRLDRNYSDVSESTYSWSRDSVATPVG